MARPNDTILTAREGSILSGLPYWLLFFISIYLEMLVVVSVVAWGFAQIARRGNFAGHAAVVARRERHLTWFNLMIWAFFTVLLSVTWKFVGFPKVVNFNHSWVVTGLLRSGLIYSIPHSRSVSEQFPWFYYPLWFVFVLLVVDCTFYWTHRWMHVPRWYKIAHRTHHQFHAPSAWCAYGFHAVEGALLALTTLYLPYMLLPISPTPALAFSLFAATWAAFLHSGIDTTAWQRRAWLRKVYAPSHHRLHHAEGEFNYGLYFTFWDEAMGTLSPELR